MSEPPPRRVFHELWQGGLATSCYCKQCKHTTANQCENQSCSCCIGYGYGGTIQEGRKPEPISMEFSE